MKVEAFTDPFKHWIAEPLLPGWDKDLLTAYTQTPPATWDGWEAHYDNDCERGKRTTRAGASISAEWDRLFAKLLSPEFVAWLAGLTGVPDLRIDPELYGAGIHVTEPGGHLACHLDYSRHSTLDLERRINLVLFLNPRWREEWGGAFELWDDSARNCVKRIYPAFGRAVVWEASDLAYHGTQKVEKAWMCAKGNGCGPVPSRTTAAVYYLASPRPNCTRKRALFVPSRG